MTDAEGVIWFSLLGAALAIWAIERYLPEEQEGPSDDERIDAWRREAEWQFDGIVVESDHPAAAFRGESADVVDQVEEIERIGSAGRPIGYKLRRYARNEAGEYFMFVTTCRGRPTFKHLPQEIARLALRDKYVAPRKR